LNPGWVPLLGDEAVTSVVFVHGTGVREPGFSDALARVRSELTARRPDVTVVPCYWGHEHGTRLHLQGVSIPTYNTTRGQGAAPAYQSSQNVEMWRLLYQDPTCELGLLAIATPEPGELPPSREPPGTMLDRAVQSLRLVSAPPEARSKLEAAGIAATFDAAREKVAASVPYDDMLRVVPPAFGDYRVAVARAIVAQAVVDRSKADNSVLPLDGTTRDALVQDIARWMGEERLAGSWVASKLLVLAQKLGAIDHIQRRRGAVTDGAFPFTGDILLYQARGEGIRSAIRMAIKGASPPVVVLGHSLGGIASVDLLALEAIPEVALLVTVGSQAPILYELDALVSLRYGTPLPAHVPPWLNVYDLRDFLSYVGAEIFPGRIEDVKVDSKQPFPESHSAYWANPSVWNLIAGRLPR
jgi:hypothetical protein